MSEQIYVGIDIAKDTFCVATSPRLISETMSNTPADHRKLCRLLREHNTALIVIEATGDTMFIGGCGRPLECDAKTMWTSLQKIAALPDDLQIYPGHDYTKENYEFALTIEPGNQAVKNLLEQHKFAPPSTIAREKQTNIFLRANTPQTFAQLRRQKDIFG